MKAGTLTSHRPATPLSRQVQALRGQFPILSRQVHHKPLVYLDNAATTQKPRCVLEALEHYYTTCNANVHRSPHRLSEEATQAYEGARQKLATFIGAEDPSQIIFVRGTTEAINLVAQSYGDAHVREGDEVLITTMEHHSNIVPWQLLCQRRGAVLRVIPIDDRGQLCMEELPKLLNERTRIVAVTHISNALGTINPVKEIAAMAHQHGAVVLVDGAQAAPHQAIDVRDLGCDFYAFSGHKMYGPTGIGVLYGKRELLEAMPPWQGGGEMIEQVTFECSTFRAPPARFEAGTPDVAGAIGLKAAVDFLQSLDLARIAAYENELLHEAAQSLSAIPGLRIIGQAEHKAAVISFVMDGVHPHDLGTILDASGVAIRAGHHCAQPVMQHFNVPATARVSLALYNTPREIQILVEGVKRAAEMWR